MGRYLVFLAASVVIVGLAWPWLAKLGLGRLPGDINVRRGRSTWHLPITSSVLVSVLLSMLFWLFRR